MASDAFIADISRHVWDTKYRHRDGARILDQTVADTWRRIARALAAAEPGDQEARAAGFYDALSGFQFLPGGRIQAGAGVDRRITLFNCFVMGRIEDSMERIFDHLKEGALTLQQGGGVGYDFSTLRPQGRLARHSGTIASGPVSFMRIWDAMCATLLSTGARRGAMMATLRCDHPDIETYVDAKADPRELRHFNLSVQVTDAFMEAVQEDQDWPLIFPAAWLDGDEAGGTVERHWPGAGGNVACRVLRTVGARDLWHRIMRATYDYAEPGTMFVDRVNEQNNLWYREHITATNPCGEIPLQPYGACDLGSVNLTTLVREPFSEDAHLDDAALRRLVQSGVRMLDNNIDCSGFPLSAQAEQARGTRRIGLGLTGLGDALIMLGLHYGSEQARSLASRTMRIICHTAYRSSIELAREKGPFPFLDRERYLQGSFVRSLPEDIRSGIAEHGIRNSHLLAIAPTGTISLVANNISSGLEPVYAFQFQRRVLEADSTPVAYDVVDYAYRLWREEHGEEATLPDYFVNALALEPRDHLAMQAAIQPYVDNAVSKTINIPEDYPFERFRDVYEQAYAWGLKGCTTYRPNPITGGVLAGGQVEQSAHCCTLEREAD